MNSRMTWNAVAIILLLMAGLIVWPATSFAQIKKGSVPTEMTQPPTENPPKQDEQRPADTPEQPSVPPESTRREITPAASPADRTPGVPDKRVEVLIRIKPEAEGTSKTSEREGGEVEVLKGAFPGNNYKIVYYRREGATVREYAAYSGGTRQFDCAYFLWKNESTVVVRLYNTTTQQELRVELTGKDGVSGMKADY